jgi:hypothetical protein
VFGNGLHGIEAAALLRGNVAGGNAGDGIRAAAKSLVGDNTSATNSAAGIAAAPGSFVHRNSATGNSGFGLDLSSSDPNDPRAVFHENVMSGNQGGPVQSGLSIAPNQCEGSQC